MPFVGRDGKTTYIRVKQQLDPYRNVKATGSPDKYEPTSINFSQTSSMANKSFSDSDLSLSKNNESLESHEQRSFITKSYFGNDTKTSSGLNFDNKFSTSSAATNGHGLEGLDKSYPVSSTDTAQNKSALFASNSSDLQNRSANLGQGKTATFASPLSHKPYLGPESEALHHEMSQVNDGLIQLKDLPNRPLTIDEVRALINHGVVPDTDAKPEPPSKPLNDPDYKPEPSPATPPTEDSDEGVPSPGTMSTQPQAAPPENTEALPSK